MTCHDHLRALRDHAAGAALTPRLEAHLGTCASCAAALDAERSLLDEIDVALTGASQAEPSRAFLARVQALGDRPESSRIPPSGLRVAAAVLVLGVSAAVIQRFAWIDTPAAVPPALVSSASSTAALPPPRKASSIEPSPPSAPPPRPVRVAAAIVPPGQEALAGRFAALVDSGVVDLAPQALETDLPGLPLRQAPELFVPPLTIAPIEADEAPSEE
jgi:hypothetical protein